MFGSIASALIGTAVSSFGKKGSSGGGTQVVPQEEMPRLKTLGMSTMSRPIESTQTQPAKLADYDRIEQKWLGRMNAFRSLG
jgi:hypothetical protein